MQFAYPMALTLDDRDGGFVVSCRDLPEAITQGETVADCLREAADCLEEAIAARLDDRREIPLPSPAAAGEYAVAVPIQTALKAALYLALRETGVSPGELARRLGANEQQVQHWLDPRRCHPAETLERALAALDRRLTIDVRAAA